MRDRRGNVGDDIHRLPRSAIALREHRDHQMPRPTTSRCRHRESHPRSSRSCSQPARLAEPPRQPILNLLRLQHPPHLPRRPARHTRPRGDQQTAASPYPPRSSSSPAQRPSPPDPSSAARSASPPAPPCRSSPGSSSIPSRSMIRLVATLSLTVIISVARSLHVGCSPGASAFSTPVPSTRSASAGNVHPLARIEPPGLDGLPERRQDRQLDQARRRQPQVFVVPPRPAALDVRGREGHDARRWIQQLDQRRIHYPPFFGGALGRTRTAVPLTSESAGSRITASAGVRPATTSTVRP